MKKRTIELHHPLRKRILSQFFLSITKYIYKSILQSFVGFARVNLILWPTYFVIPSLPIGMHVPMPNQPNRQFLAYRSVCTCQPDRQAHSNALPRACTQQCLAKGLDLCGMCGHLATPRAPPAPDRPRAHTRSDPLPHIYLICLFPICTIDCPFSLGATFSSQGSQRANFFTIFCGVVRDIKTTFGTKFQNFSTNGELNMNFLPNNQKADD